jgi:hypothetical protein
LDRLEFSHIFIPSRDSVTWDLFARNSVTLSSNTFIAAKKSSLIPALDSDLMIQAGLEQTQIMGPHWTINDTLGQGIHTEGEGSGRLTCAY